MKGLYKITIVLVLTITGLQVVSSCKPKQKVVDQKVAEQKPPIETNVQPVKAKTIGKVSHQYRATGCATVIVVKRGEEELVLIPKDTLTNKLDVDGLEITFNYRTLKMPQPQGCMKGIPAALTDIEKK
jgi:hypothetical protein